MRGALGTVVMLVLFAAILLASIGLLTLISDGLDEVSETDCVAARAEGAIAAHTGGETSPVNCTEEEESATS